MAQRIVVVQGSWRAICQVFDAHQKVKVIPQQAIGECPRDRFDVFQVELQKVVVIPLFNEDILAVVTAIVDVIDQTVLKWNGSHAGPHKT